ncbi:hypothetical protein ACEXOS_010230 [Herbiconiux sp. P16]|uniref:hypothetical protein n=1 Tax=Herbiconiux wuyangfengii TaxID=3342794 RepID=UPI0035BA40CF
MDTSLRARRRTRIRAAGTTLLVVALTAAAAIAGAPAAYADDYPSWDDVIAARGNESAKQDEIAKLQNVIADNEAKAAAAQAKVAETSDAYDQANAALNAGQLKSDTLAATAAAAATKAEESKKRAAQMAAQFVRSGGTDLTTLLLTSDSSHIDDLLAQLSAASQLTQSVNAVYASAEQDANTATSLSQQAEVAKQELTTLAAAAQAALEAAAAAQREAVAILQENYAHKDEMDAQLASLQQNLATTEQQYQAGVAARAAAAAKAAADAAAAAHQGGQVVGPVSGDAQALAEELMGDVAAGTFWGSTPDHIFEIAWIAQGQDVANCSIDVTILQAMVAAVRAFGSAGVSDISRRCTGQIEGAGTASAHYMQGGGHAVDFTSVGGVRLDGANDASLNLIAVLDPMMPNGSRVGQAQCRYSAGNEPSFQNFIDFEDSCDHLHIDDF